MTSEAMTTLAHKTGRTAHTPEHPLLAEARRIGEERRLRAAAYTGPALTFTHLGHDREADMPWLSHAEAAGQVRMLLRSDLDHEAICCMARDRILHLAQENERLRAALEFIRDGYDNQDVNHIDFRVKAYEVALDALDRAALSATRTTGDQS